MNVESGECHVCQIVALRRVDWDLIESNAKDVEYMLEFAFTVAGRKIRLALERKWARRAIDEVVDSRVNHREALRAQRRNLAAIRNLRKELGL